ncbi:MAG: hypothetical protein A2V90_06955 [Gammaproteobacteria bacterium RBG_16_57_12]|nr:MAG: hypothetical protein A2V90_06955 [Gammaproteobacteria bacterium RBG_16_57_12]
MSVRSGMPADGLLIRSVWFIPALALTILVLTLLAYWPGMEAGFFLDDDSNIVMAPALHWTEITADGVRHVAEHALLPLRFVANLSFALNHYISALAPAPYHWTNLVIHLGVGAALLWVILLLQPREQSSQQRWAMMAALLAAGLFLLHPLNIQAVTYTVQRMTLLAALFSLLAVALYLSAWNRTSRAGRLWLGSASLLCWLLALFSKEIAVVLPLVIIIYEACFNAAQWRLRLSRMWQRAGGKAVIALIVTVLVAAGLMLVWQYGPALRWSETFPNRDFNGYQRVLTELRVQFFYLSLLFWPGADRLNLEHDFLLSTGLFTPWTTVLAAIGLLSILLGASWLARRQPRYGFPLLAYLALHLIESGPIDLELVFEHRMYLPMTMLAVLAANLLIDSGKRRTLALLLVAGLLVPLTIVAHQRNLVWGDPDPLRLLYDCAEKSPNKFRAQFNLGTQLGRYGRLVEAERVLVYARTLNPQHSEIYNQLGNVYLLLRRQPEAIWHYQQSVINNPANAEAQYNLAMMYESVGQIPQAIEHYRQFLEASARVYWLQETRNRVIMKLGAWGRG